MQPEEKIEKARQLLQPIKYKSFDIGFYVLKNGIDMGGEDFCENCIDAAVKEARNYHREQRKQIIEKYDKISEDGYYRHGKKKIAVTQKLVDRTKRYKLREYPARASFTFEGHDPDFGGGLEEPCCCGDCGEYFTCNFESDIEEVNHLLFIMPPDHQLTDRDKWEIDIALSNYKYATDDVKLLLDKIAEIIL